MIDKKRLLKTLIIILLIAIIIFAINQIRKTLAKYQTEGDAQRDVDVAFWIVDNSFQTERILVEDIYPRQEPFEYTFTVSNFNQEGQKAETDLEYDITITASTYLPLSYEISKDGVICTKDDQLYMDNDNTYYRQIQLLAKDNDFSMDSNINETDTLVMKITFPEEYSSNSEYADLIEDIKIELSARQIIDE